jgi:GNAT superfamily N-acetyltransferase
MLSKMFWKGKLNITTMLYAFLRKNDVALATIPAPELSPTHGQGVLRIKVGSLEDVAGMAKLLNENFEQSDAAAKTDISVAWLRSTFLLNHAIWIVAKDAGGTVRGCVASFRCDAPYPNSLSGGCGKPSPWGLVDWFCIHPLWRGKGVGSELLDALDLITFRIGRKAHVFLKEGLPLSLPHIPVYTTWLRCRLAGNIGVKRMRQGTGILLTPYQAVERSSGLPLVKVEGPRGCCATPEHIKAWEDALDRELPSCWVFVTMADKVDEKRAWRQDSMVSMYAFRWVPGKWLGSVPSSDIL